MLAFVLTINGEDSIEIEVLKGNGEHIHRCAIGFCDETDSVFSVVVALSPQPGSGDLGHYEIVFHVLEHLSDGEFIDYTDGLQTRFLDGHAREIVMNIICTCTAGLIDAVKPTVVSMVTREPDLPEKALLKYHRIALVFSKYDYRSGRGDPWHGLQIWMMERL